MINERVYLLIFSIINKEQLDNTFFQKYFIVIDFQLHSSNMTIIL